MSDESRALKDDIHIRCPLKDCNGNLTDEGVKKGLKYYRCCICLDYFVKVAGKYKRAK